MKYTTIVCSEANKINTKGSTHFTKLVRYMKKFAASLVLITLFSGCAFSGEAEDKLLSMSVTVKTPCGTGSGTIFTKGDKSYILTCGHVACGAKTIGPDGKTELVEDLDVVQTLFKNGKEVGELSLKAKLVAISLPEEEGGIDLALLEVRRGKDDRWGAAFLEDDKLGIGDELWHVGSLYGDVTNSLVKGHVARMDFRLKDWHSSFNVANLNSRPGSSGGGVWTKVGTEFKYCGMVVRGDGAGIALMKPVEVIKVWLKEVGHEELLVPDLDGKKMPKVP